MFEQDNLEQHFRNLAQQHESPFEPDDWADMQARLQKTGLIATPARSPLRQMLRRTGVMLALVGLIGGLIWQKTPLPIEQQASKTAIQKPQIVQVLPKENETEKARQASKSNQSAKKQSLYNSKNANTPSVANGKNSTINQLQNDKTDLQAMQNLPAVPSLPTETGKEKEDKSTILLIGEQEKTDLQEGKTRQIASVLNEVTPIGVVLIEPFMHKEKIDLPAVPMPETNRIKDNEGYQHLDIFASESLHANLSFKIGKERAYSIFSAGYQFSGGGRLALGFGVGKEIHQKPLGSINVECLLHYLKENTSVSRLNLLQQIKLQFNRKFNSNLTGFVGLGSNVLITDYRGEDLATSALMPEWAILRTSIDGVNIKIWTGVNFGVSVRLQ